MRKYSVSRLLIGLAASSALLSTQTHAGGLAVREQSAQFQGSSFAGNAAGGGLSSSFWNSAAISSFEGKIQSESHVSVIYGYTKITADNTSPSAAFGGAKSTEFDDPALLGSSYAAYRLNDKVVVGMAFTAPFGLATKADDANWEGRVHHRSASLKTYNLNPMASYQIAPGVSVGFGAQVQLADLEFRTKASPLAPNNSVLDGEDYGFGFTAGILFEPTKSTSVGIGFRSKVAHDIEGAASVAGAPGLGRARFKLNIETPEMVTVSIRQKLTSRLRALATVEWTNWSRLTNHEVNTTSGTLAGAPPGSNIANFDFQYNDGWFFALGGEYDISKQLTLRTGAAYEISPVQEAAQRLLQVPDSNRIWLSVGASYKMNERMSFDIGYSHVFFEDARINRLPASSNPALQVPFVGKSESSSDILSFSFKNKF